MAAPSADPVPPPRRVFANRTLNLRSVDAIGYDMDYTLLHYRVEEWETRAFEHARTLLGGRGLPVADLRFDVDDFIQGLAIDLDLGNLVKATRFGYIIRAQHGTRPLSFDELRSTYAGVFVDLNEPRFAFLNTLFSLSEASLYAQLVDRLDRGEVPGVMGYDDLYRTVRSALDESHATGALKSEIVHDPDRYLELDPTVVETLLDQRAAGKRLLLVTNSEWAYTSAMMRHAFDRFVPDGGWRQLFDLVVVAASKPRFFEADEPVFEVVDTERGLLAPHHGDLMLGGVYHGGNARLVERSLGLAGDQLLYVGDHLFGDVHVTKATLRWRTALILRELEADVASAHDFADDEARLAALMEDKGRREDELAMLRLRLTRRRDGRGAPGDDDRQLRRSIEAALAELRALDERIGPLARAAGELGNRVWGPLMRAGSDKSLLARQVERYADVYTSRVSNFGLRSPYALFRAARTSLPHDVAARPGDTGDTGDLTS